MSAPLWAVEAAERFWEGVGEPEPFPRTLRRAIALSLPLAVVLLPRLRVARMDEWLRDRGVECPLGVADRGLRACLVARRGQGLLFVDGTDAEDEQRFSLAHELAHYLRHYQEPRRRAAEGLGLEILEVLDGERPPRDDERAHALLARVRIGYHVHLMDRTDAGGFGGVATARAEDEADLLAYELLAPASAVAAMIGGALDALSRAALAELLRGRCGLPADSAHRYAARLAPGRRGDPFLARLRAAP